jgi:hypothetical protein
MLVQEVGYPLALFFAVALDYGGSGSCRKPTDTEAFQQLLLQSLTPSHKSICWILLAPCGSEVLGCHPVNGILFMATVGRNSIIDTDRAIWTATEGLRCRH